MSDSPFNSTSRAEYTGPSNGGQKVSVSGITRRRYRLVVEFDDSTDLRWDEIATLRRVVSVLSGNANLGMGNIRASVQEIAADG